MAAKVRLTTALRAFDVSRNAFAHWQKVGAIRTEYPPTVERSAASVTPENALEIGIMATLTKLGTAPGGAGRTASLWMAEEAASPSTFARFIAVNAADGMEIPFSDPSIGFEDLAQMMAADIPGGWVTPRDSAGRPVDGTQSATAITIIDRRGIFDRARALFEAE